MTDDDTQRPISRAEMVAALLRGEVPPAGLYEQMDINQRLRRLEARNAVAFDAIAALARQQAR